MAQHAMERKMLHITLHHYMIRSTTKAKDILEKIKAAKWKCAGHVARREDNRWTKRLQNSN